MKTTIHFLFFFIACNCFGQKELISDFYQGDVVVDPGFKQCIDDDEPGNCATIALIKSAIGQFGQLENIFQHFTTSQDTLSAVFNDKVSVFVTESERQIVKQLSGIQKKDKSAFYESAVTIYALICKRVLMASPDTCIHNFTNAVEYINCGYNTPYVPELLGMKAHFIKVRNLEDHPAAIIWSGAHASFCAYGIQDIYGEPHSIKVRWMKNPRGIGGYIQGAFILEK